MTPAFLVALLATLASVAALWPQVRRAIRARDLSGFAPSSSTTTIAAFGLWTTYGALIGSAAIVATTTIFLFASTLAVSVRLLFTPCR